MLSRSSSRRLTLLSGVSLAAQASSISHSKVRATVAEEKQLSPNVSTAAIPSKKMAKKSTEETSVEIFPDETQGLTRRMSLRGNSDNFKDAAEKLSGKKVEKKVEEKVNNETNQSPQKRASRSSLRTNADMSDFKFSSLNSFLVSPQKKAKLTQAVEEKDSEDNCENDNGQENSEDDENDSSNCLIKKAQSPLSSKKSVNKIRK